MRETVEASTFRMSCLRKSSIKARSDMISFCEGRGPPARTHCVRQQGALCLPDNCTEDLNSIQGQINQDARPLTALLMWVLQLPKPTLWSVAPCPQQRNASTTSIEPLKFQQSSIYNAQTYPSRAGENRITLVSATSFSPHLLDVSSRSLAVNRLRDIGG